MDRTGMAAQKTSFTFPDPKTVEPRGRFAQRALELIPGTLTWATILGMFVGSWLAPVGAAVFVIVFDIYWIYLTVYVAFFSIMAYRGLRRGVRINWWERVVQVRDPGKYRAELLERSEHLRAMLREEKLSFRERRIIRKERRELVRYAAELRELEPIREQILDYRDIVHVVLLPTANEGPEIIEPSIRSIAESSFPKSQVIILLATEEREPEETRLPKVKYLEEKFRGVFRDFIVTTHEVASGEMRCTSPHIYLSSMTSPRTSTRLEPHSS